MGTRLVCNSYETIMVMKGEISDDVENQLVTKINELIARFQGQIIRQESWGKKRLAYIIKKETKGRYVYWYYKALPEGITEIERNMRLNENVLRYMTIKLNVEEIKKLENNQKHAFEADDSEADDVSLQ